MRGTAKPDDGTLSSGKVRTAGDASISPSCHHPWETKEAVAGLSGEPVRNRHRRPPWNDCRCRNAAIATIWASLMRHSPRHPTPVVAECGITSFLSSWHPRVGPACGSRIVNATSGMGVELGGICPALTPTQSPFLRHGIQPKLRETKTHQRHCGRLVSCKEQIADPIRRDRADVCCAQRAWRARVTW